jgi:ketosteroid isomerase-like protein
MSIDRRETTRAMYRAYETGEREVLDERLAEDFTFYAPPDPGIDRDTYFERCWPNAGNTASFEFERMIEAGEEVIVTYEATRKDGSRFRNTEVVTFRGDDVVKVEVYFGWDL